MEQLIKKVNMIDILGMLLPGGLMLLLLEQDIHWIRDLSSYLGINAGNILMIMIFLCGSYAVGMLLHELGSVIEKMMWKNPILDPHVYAAISTKLVTRYDKQGQLKQKQTNTNGDNQKTIMKRWAKLWPNLKQILKNKWKKIGRLVLSSLPSLLIGAVALGLIPLGVSLWRSLKIVSCTLVILILGIFWQLEDVVGVLEAYVDIEKRNKLKLIKRDRVLIEGDSDTTEENARKRGLFNGYYAMARSLIVMMVLLQCYACLQPEGSASSFMQLVEKINANPAYLFLWVMVALLLMGRYWHFVRTRFSYAYHGFVYNKDNPKKLEVKEITHIGVIGSDNQIKDTLEVKRFLK